LVRIAKPCLQKLLACNGNLGKLHRSSQHSCVFCVE
jgi:hypothetical protein